MPDAQFLAAGTQAAPLDYTLPGAQELLLKACFAHFDGSGAASAYLPTLQILGPAGDTVVEIPMDSSVAAGSSVEATWAPFLKGAQTTPIAGAHAFLRRSVFNGDAAQSVPAGNSAPVKWKHFWASDKTVFGTSTGGIPLAHNAVDDTVLQVLKPGFAYFAARTLWEAGDYNRAVLILNAGNASMEIEYQDNQQADKSFVSTGFGSWVPESWDMNVFEGISSGGSASHFDVYLQNGDVVARNAEYIIAEAFWLPFGWPLTGVY